ncbi:MAG TPA: protein kinase, partial [Ktedonobacterales bacterium]
MTPSFFHVGQRLTDYARTDVIVEREDCGGFGAVAMGPNQGNGGAWSALKTLRPDLLAGQERATRARLQSLFLRESLTWIGLWPHPNLLTAQFVTEINGQPMLVLDYAERGSLQDLFDAMRQQGNWFTVATGIHIAEHIAAGLVALHTPAPDLMRNEPIVHRDLKPGNILLDQYGYAMITDFGMAKAVAEALDPAEGADFSVEGLAGDTTAGPVASGRTQVYRTQRGQALGTPVYMAPEQWEDASLAERPADAYAFGLIL